MSKGQVYQRVPEWEFDDLEGASHKSPPIDNSDFSYAHAHTLQRWSRRSLVVAISFVVFTTVSLAFVVNPSLRLLVSSTGDGADGLDAFLGRPKELEDGFTILTPTYKRVERLPKFLDNYANGNITSLRRIVLRWADEESDPPADLVASLGGYAVPVIIEREQNHSLIERFRVSENISTNAILSLDDDLLFKPHDIEFAYHVWQKWAQGRRRMVGFHPREVAKDGKYLVDKTGTYSMVLTGTAFLHHDWITAFWSNEPAVAEGRRYVEENGNCEDILMNFMFAHYTRTPPIHVKADFEELGSGGISLQPGHLDRRTECIRKFQGLFGNDTLVSTDFSVRPY